MIKRDIMTTKMLTEQNRKMIKSARYDEKFVSFDLPAGDTCPCKGICAADCYAKAGHFIFKNNKKHEHENWVYSTRPEFVEMMDTEIRERYGYVKKLFVRIHATGDFYDRQYLLDWIAIANDNKDVTFYAYTKCVTMIKSIVLPDNFIVGFSYGGIEDRFITDKDRRIAVFGTIPDEWADGDGDDHVMMNNLKTGLTYHGPKKYYDRTAWPRVQIAL